jgi:hypothetical protein
VEPGLRGFQVPRQSVADTGVSEAAQVVKNQDANDGFTYPAVASIVKVSIDFSVNYNI